jgi:hypothetical protein
MTVSAQQYAVRVKHDNGVITIRTAASSPDAAKEIVMCAERCPERSIISVKVKSPRTRYYPSKSVLQSRLSSNAVECFYVSAEDARRARYDAKRHNTECGTPSAGWYYWTCLPGCLPDSEPFGPHASPLAVLRAAYDADFLPDPINEQAE